MRVRYTLAALVVVASCSSGPGSGTPGVGGKGASAGGATAGSGGVGGCPAEVPAYPLQVGASNPYESCCPPDDTIYSGAACTTKNLVCWTTSHTPLGCALFQFTCNGVTFSTTLHYDPPAPCGGTTGTGGAGATAGSGGTAGTSGGGSGGDGAAGSGGACPAELPPGDTGFIPSSTPGYESCCSQTAVYSGAPCTTKNLLCAIQQATATGCLGTFQYKCDGTVYMPTLAHSDPPVTCTGTAGTGGRGGTGGSGGSAGTGAGGAGGQGGGGGTGGAQYIPPQSTDPWPASCLTVPLDHPAFPGWLTGPYTGSGFGAAPLPGESVTATLNGLARAFSTSFNVADTSAGNISISAYGYDGYLVLSVPMGGPGSYTCPTGSSYVSYANIRAGLEANFFHSNTNCCGYEITKVGAIGDTVEGTFSGILNSEGVWLLVEAGAFKVVRR